ncbi:uncharacterized protein MONBRDRAFT_7548 [Monosiga brevicollis MX1]|uniref:Uncharacterized protein n=1 Tax=Monosiga brevicollis TaxID=81824 RepID=A9UXB7_MONBE|nr:uncharacterized protein MONBRDRAFT_7548 [Monosiga brevicollis MX1]EDQ90191.1 predicted protein [Monosiga brevicollis MX1]|eukprot:XP_001744958.1 hypothetical protein [Monosiga brevicollis MX1]
MDAQQTGPTHGTLPPPLTGPRVTETSQRHACDHGLPSPDRLPLPISTQDARFARKVGTMDIIEDYGSTIRTTPLATRSLQSLPTGHSSSTWHPRAASASLHSHSQQQHHSPPTTASAYSEPTFLKLSPLMPLGTSAPPFISGSSDTASSGSSRHIMRRSSSASLGGLNGLMGGLAVTHHSESTGDLRAPSPTNPMRLQRAASGTISAPARRTSWVRQAGASPDCLEELFAAASHNKPAPPHSTGSTSPQAARNLTRHASLLNMSRPSLYSPLMQPRSTEDLYGGNTGARNLDLLSGSTGPAPPLHARGKRRSSLSLSGALGVAQANGYGSEQFASNHSTPHPDGYSTFGAAFELPNLDNFTYDQSSSIGAGAAGSTSGASTHSPRRQQSSSSMNMSPVQPRMQDPHSVSPPPAHVAVAPSMISPFDQPPSPPSAASSTLGSRRGSLVTMAVPRRRASLDSVPEFGYGAPSPPDNMGDILEIAEELEGRTSQRKRHRPSQDLTELMAHANLQSTLNELADDGAAMSLLEAHAQDLDACLAANLPDSQPAPDYLLTRTHSVTMDAALSGHPMAASQHHSQHQHPTQTDHKGYDPLFAFGDMDDFLDMIDTHV